jgi:hypothetical protein
LFKGAFDGSLLFQNFLSAFGIDKSLGHEMLYKVIWIQTVGSSPRPADVQLKHRIVTGIRSKATFPVPDVFPLKSVLRRVSALGF